MRKVVALVDEEVRKVMEEARKAKEGAVVNEIMVVEQQSTIVQFTHEIQE